MELYVELSRLILFALWRHQMETFSALLTFCETNRLITGGFPSQRPVTLSFDVFFDLRLNKRWFEKPSCSLWRHCIAETVVNINDVVHGCLFYQWLLTEKHFVSRFNPNEIYAVCKIYTTVIVFFFCPLFFQVRIENTSALVQIMAGRLLRDKPLSKPMMNSLLTYMCHSASMI